VIDEEWQRPPSQPTGAIGVRVAAVVPLPAEFGGSAEILALAAFGSVKLPIGDVRPGESLMAATRRVVLGTAGVAVVPERVIYVVENVGKQITFCVVCALDESGDLDDARPGFRFVPVQDADEFDPAAVRDLLVEDVRSGFVRPTAFATVGWDENGREQVSVSW
jgi:hypothetical protein